MAVVPNPRVYPHGYPKFVCKGFAERMRDYEREERAKKKKEKEEAKQKGEG